MNHCDNASISTGIKLGRDNDCYSYLGGINNRNLDLVNLFQFELVNLKLEKTK